MRTMRTVRLKGDGNFLFQLFLFLTCFGSGAVLGFYVPGVHPADYRKGDKVMLLVNSLTSTRTQLPRDYYQFPFCKPSGGPMMRAQSLGQFLTGNKIQSSPYDVTMATETYCQKICQITLSEPEATKLRTHIDYGYHNNWIVDNIPSAFIGENPQTGKQQKYYTGGFPIGFISNDTNETYVYNHVNIIIDVNKENTRDDDYRIVEFSIEPISVAHKYEDDYQWDGNSMQGLLSPLSTCTPSKHVEQKDITERQQVKVGEKIMYTYDVSWRETDKRWGSRWDVYLYNENIVAEAHWYSIFKSSIIIVLLSICIVVIIIRTTRQNLATNNENDTETYVPFLGKKKRANNSNGDNDTDKDDETNEAIAATAETNDDSNTTDWNLRIDDDNDDDVFRPPDNFPILLCACVGTGIQMAVTILFVTFLSALGILNPSRRGSLINTMLVFYFSFGGVISGYVSSRLCKAFQHENLSRLCTVTAATLFPTCAFAVFLLLNILLHFHQSTLSVPIIDIIVIVTLWLFVHIPLTFLGAYFGTTQKSCLHFRPNPVVPSPNDGNDEVTEIDVREQNHVFLIWHTLKVKDVVAVLVGLFPISCFGTEFHYLMEAVWMGRHYHIFGFLLIVYVLFIVSCAQVAILLVYCKRCIENRYSPKSYKQHCRCCWWWFAFSRPGLSSVLYVLTYGKLWFVNLDAGSGQLLTYVLYFSYMTLISLIMFLVTGSIGSLASFWFLQKIVR